MLRPEVKVAKNREHEIKVFMCFSVKSTEIAFLLYKATKDQLESCMVV